MNTDADTLSRYPVKRQDDMKEHTETMSLEVVSAVWQGSKAVQESDVPWVAALQLDGGNTEVVSPENISSVTPENLHAAQHRTQPSQETLSF